MLNTGLCLNTSCTLPITCGQDVPEPEGGGEGGPYRPTRPVPGLYQRTRDGWGKNSVISLEPAKGGP